MTGKSGAWVRHQAHRAVTWSGHSIIGLVVALLAGCGGGGSPADPPPDVAAQDFVLLPRRVALGEGGQGVMQAFASGRTVSWSSSDPAVVTVDAEGRIQAVAKGSATIRASAGTDAASTPITVFATTGASPAPSPDALIDAALAAGRIDAELALTYRVYALFGDERLPAEFDGPPSGEPDHALLRQVATTVHELSEPTQALLRPFLQAPQYADSWFARRAGLDAAVGAGRAQPARATRAATTVNCEASRLPDFFPKVSTTKFNIFYMKSLDAARDALSARVVAMIASFIEADYAMQTSLLRRAAISDLAQPCNGGDAKVDIYYGGFGIFGTPAWTTTYPLPRGTRGVNACALRPSVVMLNSASVEFLAIERSLDQGRPMARSIVAHELMHVIQLAMPRQASCADTLWFDEATAQWAMDHVVPTIARDLPAEFGMEAGVQRVAPALQKSGQMLADYLLAGHRVPIEEPGASVKRNGYADYLFFQYLARAQTPDRIRQIFDAMAGGKGSVASIAAAVDLKAAWPDFARTLWIGTEDQVLDYWATEDEYRFGLAAIYDDEPLVGVPPSRRATLKTLKVDQQGARRATFKLLEGALEFEGYTIPARSMYYEHLKFSDATVHSVYLSNPIAVLPEREFIKLQAVRKIGGQWQAPEDWTAEAYKQFCLDQKSERVEELLLIVSNSDPRPGSGNPFRFPTAFPLQVGTSNVACWGWLGTAQTVTTSNAPYHIDQTARAASLYFRVRDVLPGRVSFGTVSGLVSGRRTSTSFDGTCTYTSVGETYNICLGLGCLDAPPTADGSLDIDLDLDQGFGGLAGAPAPDRELNDLGGSRLLSTTDTAVCPAVTTTGTGEASWSWLAVSNPSRFSVSADGQTIEGRATSTDLNGARSVTTWRFTAVRQ